MISKNPIVTFVHGLRYIFRPGPTSPADGDAWLDSTQKSVINQMAGIKHYNVGALYIQTNSVTVANTVTETTLVGTGIGTVTLPANFFAIGKSLRLALTGFHSSVATPTVTVRLKLGATTIIDSGATASGNGANDGFVLNLILTCRTIGGTGTVVAQGLYQEIHSSGARVELVELTSDTIDTTASQAVSVTFQWGTASASNTVTCTNFIMEAIG